MATAKVTEHGGDVQDASTLLLQQGKTGRAHAHGTGQVDIDYLLESSQRKLLLVAQDDPCTVDQYVELVEGFGPDGRSVLRYTPVDEFIGTDFFEYTSVIDGVEDACMVAVNVEEALPRVVLAASCLNAFLFYKLANPVQLYREIPLRVPPAQMVWQGELLSLATAGGVRTVDASVGHTVFEHEGGGAGAARSL